MSPRVGIEPTTSRFYSPPILSYGSHIHKWTNNSISHEPISMTVIYWIGYTSRIVWWKFLEIEEVSFFLLYYYFIIFFSIYCCSGNRNTARWQTNRQTTDFSFRFTFWLRNRKSIKNILIFNTSHWNRRSMNSLSHFIFHIDYSQIFKFYNYLRDGRQ